MLCALTVRNLKPGAFDAFRQAFMASEDISDPPDGWVRFNMIRNTADPDQVVTFGFFDGTVEELRATQTDAFQELLESIAPHIESLGADGIFEVVEDSVS
jgi:hypothetical protein